MTLVILCLFSLFLSIFSQASPKANITQVLLVARHAFLHFKQEPLYCQLLWMFLHSDGRKWFLIPEFFLFDFRWVNLLSPFSMSLSIERLILLTWPKTQSYIRMKCSVLQCALYDSSVIKQLWWHMPIISAPGRLEQEDHLVPSQPGHIVASSAKWALIVRTKAIVWELWTFSSSVTALVSQLGESRMRGTKVILWYTVA